MISLSERSVGIEIMDDLDCKGEVVNQTLRELDIINHWLGGNAVTTSALDRLWQPVTKNQVVSIADLGCGSGEMLRLIYQRAIRQGRKVALTGIDANPNIIDFAKQHAINESIDFGTINVFSDEFGSHSYDIVIATLFMHHFTNEELISLISSLKKQCRIGIIVNDIHRHWLAYHSIRLITKFWSRSEMVKFDAPLSVLRAFNKKELVTILKKAGIENYSLRWRWAFRWQLIIKT